MTILEQRILDHLLNELQASGFRFQEQLRSQYPRLTAHDLRLCTYLKANLSTKEIATLMNISPDSTKKAKHRLRKKLNMKPWQSFDFCLREQTS